MQKIAFYCRARPQGCDALKIFKRASRVFIGYPLKQDGIDYNPNALKSCLVDPSRCPDSEWKRQTVERKDGKYGENPRFHSYTRNRNFIPSVTEGSIVVVPRPSQGVAYLARVESPFEIVDAPSWRQRYLDIRKEQGLNWEDDNKQQHTADVAQGWQVDEYRPVDLARIPGWLHRSLLGRSTYGPLGPHPLDSKVSAHSVLEEILQGQYSSASHWTIEVEDIKKRLVDTLSNPSAFENLVVALLQLNHPEEMWHCTGGPGDGGIDGYGSNENGDVVGLMQAKYYANKAPELADVGGSVRSIRRYAAVFLPENPTRPSDGTCLLNLDWIASEVRRHWRRLPLAVTLRVGETPKEANDEH